MFPDSRILILFEATSCDMLLSSLYGHRQAVRQQPVMEKPPDLNPYMTWLTQGGENHSLSSPLRDSQPTKKETMSQRWFRPKCLKSHTRIKLWDTGAAAGAEK